MKEVYVQPDETDLGMNTIVLIWILAMLVSGLVIEFYALASGRPTISRITRDWIRANRFWGWVILAALLVLFIHLLVPEI